MIYYIAGTARSGSTILDIVLGSQKDHFSLGELYFLTTNGLLDNEFCSCGNRVNACSFWKRVAAGWKRKRKLSLNEYNDAKRKYLRNKRVIVNIWNYWFPSATYSDLISDTRILYEIIYEVTGCNYLIDSSKSPQQLLLLKRTGLPFKTILLIRSLEGVFNSTRKKIASNPKKGVEKEIKPLSLYKTILIWFYINLLTIFFSNRNRIKIYYEDFIKSPFEMVNNFINLNKQESQILKSRGPFFPGHLAAGSRLRMQQKVYISDKQDDLDYKLNKFQKVIICFFNKLF